MKLSQIRDFVAVAERGSLRAAARQLRSAQPAITRSIQQLEHELAVTLFERSASGVTLTPIGEAFLRRVNVIEHELERAKEEVAQMSGQATGTVAVGISTAAHVALLPKVLPVFLRLYPDVSLEIVEGLFPSMEAQLREGEVDFYIGPQAEVRIPSEFTMEVLSENTRFVFGRRGQPLRNARSLADLTGARWVSTSLTIDPGAELNPIFEQRGLPNPHIAVHARSALTMITVAASTDLLALLPQQWLRFARAAKLLEPIAIEEPLLAPSLCLIHRARFPLTPIAQHLCDLFRRAALNQPEYR